MASWTELCDWECTHRLKPLQRCETYRDTVGPTFLSSWQLSDQSHERLPSHAGATLTHYSSLAIFSLTFLYGTVSWVCYRTRLHDHILGLELCLACHPTMQKRMQSASVTVTFERCFERERNGVPDAGRQPAQAAYSSAAACEQGECCIRKSTQECFRGTDRFAESTRPHAACCARQRKRRGTCRVRLTSSLLLASACADYAERSMGAARRGCF